MTVIIWYVHRRPLPEPPVREQLGDLGGSGLTAAEDDEPALCGLGQLHGVLEIVSGPRGGTMMASRSVRPTRQLPGRARPAS